VALLRVAAELGPGYHGRRRSSSPSERDALSEEFRRIEAPVPQFLAGEPMWVERRAKLFETGDYPDKGLTVTQADLERLVANFDLPVPILIEHAASPLELGFLTEVVAEDGELFGLIALTEEANALIERSGATALSIGLTADLTEIKEVSLVRFPRVASAQLFSGVHFDSRLESEPNWRERYESLVDQQRAGHVESEIKTLVAKGQLSPAQAPFASALLQREDAVTFDGQSVPVRDLVMKLIKSQPSHGMFGEKAFQPIEDMSGLLMLPEEVAFYKRHFPDVSLESIAQKRAR
jgi:hypothetical protein